MIARINLSKLLSKIKKNNSLFLLIGLILITVISTQIYNVNKKRVNISSYIVKSTDLIEVREKSKKLTVIDGSIQSKEREVPEYIQLDDKKKTAPILELPETPKTVSTGYRGTDGHAWMRGGKHACMQTISVRAAWL